MTNTDKLQGQVRVSILVEVSQARADTYVHTHSMRDQCPLSGWTICVMQSGDPSFRPRIHSSTGWEALNSCIILSSQEIQAQGSCLPSFRAVSSSSPSFPERPFPKGFVQSTLTPTCEIPSLLFLQLSVQKMLCSNHPIGFTNAIWKSKQSHCFLRCLGTWYSK